MKNTNEKNNSLLMHLSSLCAYIFPLGGIVVPLVVWELQKEKSESMNKEGKSVVNFNLSYALYFTIGVLMIISLAIFMAAHEANHFLLFSIICLVVFLVILSIAKFILIILGVMSANKGEDFHYPGTIKFIN
ncbi:DUF4870 domain-containing protein [Namhaeicola litoreus]|uniref:DUF4870 domain-containing protein n=1 Tax=Namhaeicola litoreus TaxID=1052145 RepID=A0ABW3Y213_9FLAO